MSTIEFRAAEKANTIDEFVDSIKAPNSMFEYHTLGNGNCEIHLNGKHNLLSFSGETSAEYIPDALLSIYKRK